MIWWQLSEGREHLDGIIPLPVLSQEPRTLVSNEYSQE